MHDLPIPVGTDRSLPFDPAAEGWEPYVDEGFVGLVGPFWQKTEGETVRYGFLAEPKHHNRRGVVQGGMLMTFADRSLGMAAWFANERRPQATIQLDVHFIDAVHIGEFVEAQSRVVRRTRSVIFMSGTLAVGTRVVATANGIWKSLARS
jgi:acyl-coenzyme A thioesterase PaaI-like protein